MRQVTPISEESVLAHLERRLIHEFPGSRPSMSMPSCAESMPGSTPSPIRGFIPLFIEKHARDELGHAP